MTFQLTSAGLTAMVTKDGDVHPDLMDEMGRRCVRLFVEANASLPDDELMDGLDDVED